MDKLLSIGDFAARSGLSPKMLRSYARAGLLMPAAVDGSSGYRYYSPAQLPQAQVVALLRRAGVRVEEIAQFMSDPDPEQLDRWDREVSTEAASRRMALGEAKGAFATAPSGPSQWKLSQKERSMPHQFETGFATEKGGRESNEDSALTSKALWAVTDGLGGLGRGDVASRRALAVLDDGFGRDQSMAGLLHSCRDANKSVFEQGADRAPEMTMGTTLVALALTSDIGAVVVNVGDSRLYRLRDGRLAQLTKDHTVAADLVESGELRADEAGTHPHRHVLTRALGVGTNVEIDHAGVSCRAGDRFLLCSDGLYQTLSCDDLKALLGAGASPEEAAAELVSAAARDAEDNATALVVSVS